MIDVLLVIIIFLMLTTTYAKFSGLEINLPTAEANKQPEKPNEIDVAVTAAGQILINKSPLAAADVKAIADGPAPGRRRPQRSGDRHQRRRQGHAPERRRRDAGGPDRGYPHFLRHPVAALMFTWRSAGTSPACGRDSPCWLPWPDSSPAPRRYGAGSTGGALAVPPASPCPSWWSAT